MTASVEEDLNSADVAFEVAGVLVGAGQGAGCDLGVVLGGLRGDVFEPGLQLEQGHWLLGVVELGCDRRPCPVAGDLAAHVAGWDCSLAAEHGDDLSLMQCLATRLAWMANR